MAKNKEEKVGTPDAPKMAELKYTEVNGVFHVKDTVPVGMKIGKTPYGFGLFASKSFKKGELIYVTREYMIPNKEATFLLLTDQGDYTLTTDTHSVAISDEHRMLYLFDSFMNHSCDPSSYSTYYGDFPKKTPLDYGTYALRDLVKGDQITADYNVFEYDAKGKEIEKCGCGTPVCQGEVRGYKYLSNEEKKKRVGLVSFESVFDWFMKDDKTVSYIPDVNKITPKGITITKNGLGTFEMTATQAFKAGEVIFQRKCEIVDRKAINIIGLLGTRVWFEGQNEFMSFHAFQNFAASPNTQVVYSKDYKCYSLKAKEPIVAGQELTQ